MENKLYFNAREWSALKLDNQVSSRNFVTAFDGKLVEVYTLGDWSWNWSEIASKPLRLEKNTEYTFTFWLNGGENDNNNETCQFIVLHTDDEYTLTDRDTEYVYKLNRNFIKPVKKYNGWELYSIPFTTEDKIFTRLKFIAMRAPMAIMPAKDISEYAELEDKPDEFEELRPQRHNIIFSDGFPNNTWYSTRKMSNEAAKNSSNFHTNNNTSAYTAFQNMNNLNQETSNGYSSSAIDSIICSIGNKIENTDIEDCDSDVLSELKEMLEISISHNGNNVRCSSSAIDSFISSISRKLDDIDLEDCDEDIICELKEMLSIAMNNL